MAPGEAIQIRSMQVLTGIGDLGAPSQRGEAMALVDYGPIKGHDVSMGAGLDSLCTAEGGRAAAEAVIGDPSAVGVIGTAVVKAPVRPLVYGSPSSKIAEPSFGKSGKNRPSGLPSEIWLRTGSMSVSPLLTDADTSFDGNTNEATGKTFDGLLADYGERYGEPPSSVYLPQAYDATTMLLRAIEEVARAIEEVAVSDGDTLYIDRARLREALTGLTGFSGIIGAISCDEFGDCGTGGVQISHHRDSSITDIADLPVVHRFTP